MTMQPAVSTLTRSLTGAVQALAVLLAAGATTLGLLLTASIAFGEFSTSVSVVPDWASAPDVGQDGTYSWVYFDSVRVVHPDPPDIVRLLKWTASAAVGVVVLTGCVVAFTLARRLRTGRPFSRFASWSLLLLGALAVAAAFVSPALLGEATAAAVSDLGLRVADVAGFAAYEASEEPTALLVERFPSWGSVIRDTDWALAGVGGILAVISFAFRRGATLQRDTEGLV